MAPHGLDVASVVHDPLVRSDASCSRGLGDGPCVRNERRLVQRTMRDEQVAAAQVGELAEDRMGVEVITGDDAGHEWIAGANSVG